MVSSMLSCEEGSPPGDTLKGEPIHLMERSALPMLLIALGIALCPASPAGAGEGGCLDCHDLSSVSSGERSIHSPFRQRDCAGCHLDHGDEERLVLNGEGNALCARCHDFEDYDFLKPHSGLPAGRAQCLSCHDPHRSPLPTLLIEGRHRPLMYGRCDPCHRFDGRIHEASVKEQCLTCHDKEEFSRSFGHSPAVEGDCLECHDPHGSRRRALLLEEYSGGRWTGGSAEAYALCLDCHEEEILSSPGTDERTAFRSGATNLHRVHIEGEGDPVRPASDRGMTCRNCHEAHSSNYPRLIRAALDCGGVPCLRLEFRTLDGGGECTVSCHGTRAYFWDGSTRTPPPSPPPPPKPRAEEPPSPPLTDLERSINRRCRNCHETDVLSFSRPVVHSPVRMGNCSACHLDHGSENRLVLLAREDRLCGRCHDLRGQGLGEAHRGYSLQGSRCTECHDPHASAKRFLLYDREHDPFAERDCGACHRDAAEGWALGAGINEVCRECHDEVTAPPFLHTALPRRSCTGCHRPHAGSVGKFLRAEGERLCFLCHSSEAFRRENTHPPVAEGDCGACHPPHGAQTEGLFVAPYPLGQYADFRTGAYGLCWECHDEALAAEPVSTDTGFRTGDRSLHATHVQNNRTESELGERVSPGLTCRNCHDPHSTENPRLMRQELDCGGVPCLQLEYHKVGEGGKCLGGCHVRQSYLP